jgi:D-glycero-D-manno-heptose 1,7-bisphosphate phosphatase
VSRRGVILDRDGTLIDFYRDAELGVVTPAFHPDHVRLLPGVVEGLTLLRDAGFALAAATNQPDAAKGRVAVTAIERTNAELRRQLAAAGLDLAAFETCLHHPELSPGGDPALVGPCSCRKPAPGMLETIIAALDLDRAQSWMIGDTAADLAAADAARLRCALVFQLGRCELCPLVGSSAPPLVGRRPALTAPRLDDLARAIIAS